MNDTLSYLSTSATAQQIAVIIQGVLLALGALLTLIQKVKK